MPSIKVPRKRAAWMPTILGRSFRVPATGYLFADVVVLTRDLGRQEMRNHPIPDTVTCHRLLLLPFASS
jgi:hypothetical protein